jgi:hypothetical protein
MRKIGLAITCLLVLMLSGSLQAEVVIQLPWGEGLEQIGLIDLPEVERVGPTGFCLDNEGNIYIVDYVNQAVKKISADGTIEIVAEGVAGNHVAAGRKGRLYVRCDDGIIQVFGQGRLMKTLKVSSDIPLIEGYEQSVNIGGGLQRSAESETVFVNDLAHNQYAVADSNGTRFNENVSHTGQPGCEARDGNRYQPKWKSRHLGLIMRHNNSGGILQPIEITAGDDLVGGIAFKGLDSDGNIVVEIERITSDGYAHLEVRKYSPAGELLITIEIPNDYYTTVYRRTFLGSDDMIYQLLTAPEGVTFLKWSLEVGE